MNSCCFCNGYISASHREKIYMIRAIRLGCIATRVWVTQYYGCQWHGWVCIVEADIFAYKYFWSVQVWENVCISWYNSWLTYLMGNILVWKYVLQIPSCQVVGKMCKPSRALRLSGIATHWICRVEIEWDDYTSHIFTCNNFFMIFKL